MTTARTPPDVEGSAIPRSSLSPVARETGDTQFHDTHGDTSKFSDPREVRLFLAKTMRSGRRVLRARIVLATLIMWPSTVRAQTQWERILDGKNRRLLRRFFAYRATVGSVAPSLGQDRIQRWRPSTAAWLL